ncbi:MAG TPA: threonine--tRNA ligase, partial [Jatrophihabitantaceae bacterium]
MSTTAPRQASAQTVKVAAGTTAIDALREAGVELNGPSGAVVVREVGTGTLRDLAWAPDADAEVEPVPAESLDGLAVLRHSAAHVLAQAVQDLFPGTLLGIGPPIENGFYYDFAPAHPFTPDDLPAIEKRMGEIIKAGQRFHRREVSDADARIELDAERFKLELIDLKGNASGEEATEVGAGGLTMYDNLDAKSGELVWTDLCRGPHLPTTRRIPAFKLMRTAAAYWRGSEKNPQLQRIYGTAWASRDDLKAHLTQLEEAAKRDHRKLGAELDLFSFPDELGSGLPVFHPKGGVLRRVLEDYVRQRHIDEGFDFVSTPHISKDGLFYTSGHLPYYADTMFPPMELENAEYRLKAMNCPMHNLIYRSRGRSYRELPLRLFELGSVYRFEKSGVVHGLTRVRGLTMDDSHSYCTPEQAPAEIKKLLEFLLGLLRDFGLDDFYLELSTRDATSDKFIGSDEDWERATKTLEDAGRHLPVVVAADELVLGVVAGRQLQVEVTQAEVGKQAQDEPQQMLDLVRRLFGGAVGVRVVHGQAAHPGQAVHHAGLLEPVDPAELEQPQRQLTVGTPPRAVDQVVHRAVHGLEEVAAVLQLHRREHRVFEVGQVPGGVEQPLLADVRGADVVEPLLYVPL